MKFTKKQSDELHNRHMGGGTIAIRTGEKEYSYVDIYLAKNGEYYLVNNSRKSIKLFDWLKDEAAEIIRLDDEIENGK